MFHYGAPTPKRTVLYSSSKAIGLFWTAPLKKIKLQQAREVRGEAPKPCRAYRDDEGRARYHGTPALKKTEMFGCKGLSSLGH